MLYIIWSSTHEARLIKLTRISYYDLEYFPTVSIFKTYNAGTANSNTLRLNIRNQKVIEFLSVVSKFYNRIVNVNCELDELNPDLLELQLVLSDFFHVTTFREIVNEKPRWLL